MTEQRAAAPLAGKVVRPAAGSRGVGRSVCMAVAAAAAAADVVIAGRNEQACAEIANPVTALGRHALAHSCRRAVG